MTAPYFSSHEQPKKCPKCNLSIERVLIGGSAKCDLTRCSECGYEMHIVDYHTFSLGETCERLKHEYFKPRQEAIAHADTRANR